MTYSINNSVAFSAINWGSFENRPEIESSMPFCTEENWDQNVKCCVDGYSIEHVLDEASQERKKTKALKFLENYPCINGFELDSFAYDKMPLPAKNPLDIPITPIPEPSVPKTDDEEACDSRAVNAFLKFAKQVKLDDTPEVSRLKQGIKISCDALINIAVRYGRASR